MTESQKNREFVESKWTEIRSARNGSFIRLTLRPGFSSVLTDWEFSIDAAYAAAEKITVSHLEAIRQIEEEMQIVARDVHNKSSWSRSLIKRGLADKARKIAIQGCRSARTLARLEAWRDEMKRGMR